MLSRHSPRSASRSTVQCHEGVLPALSVMNKLHQQPYDGSRVYNVELMGYDECFENLDLVVDRRGLWKDALRVFMQSMLLPFFILFPPIWWLKLFKTLKCCNCCKCGLCCCRKEFKVRPRYRPVRSMVPDFEVRIVIHCHILELIHIFIVNVGLVINRIWIEQNKFRGISRPFGVDIASTALFRTVW